MSRANLKEFINGCLDAEIAARHFSPGDEILLRRILRQEIAGDKRPLPAGVQSMYYLYIFTYITQPYIENAIELGIRNKEQPGNFSVRITKNEENLRVEIQDDGVGRQAVKEILKKRNSNYKSLSTGIIEERIKIFNRKSRNKISLEIIDLLDDSGAGCGTEVIIWFKSWWANPAQFSSTLTKFPRL